MATLNSDKSWISYGKKNAYYGVLSDDQYLDKNLTDESKKKFFSSGYTYVDNIFKIIYKDFDEEFRPNKAVDFGCGTGRLAIPLAKKAVEVVAVDVSDDMIEEARVNAKANNLSNITFRISDDFVSDMSGEKFDLINSYIVFQHINLERGQRIFKKLIESLNLNGIGVIHLTYENKRSTFKRVVDKFRYRIPYFDDLLNLIRGKSTLLPLMQMNNYNLNKIFLILQNEGIEKMQTIFTDHGGYFGVVLIFQRKENTGKSL